MSDALLRNLVVAGEFDPEFQGMHRFERMLWRDEITQGNNSFTTMGMNAWATKLQETYVALGAKIDMVRP